MHGLLPLPSLLLWQLVPTSPTQPNLQASAFASACTNGSSASPWLWALWRLLCGQLWVVLCAASTLESLTAKTELLAQRLPWRQKRVIFWAENVPRKKILAQYTGHFVRVIMAMPTGSGWTYPGGMLQLSQLLFLCQEAAAAAKRDETPLRLISWLNQLDSELESFVEKAMQHLSTGAHDDGQVLLQLGAKHVGKVAKLEPDTTPRVKISYVFMSHDHIHHVRIQWDGHLLLLFSDSKMVGSDYTTKFKEQSSHVTHQQHLQMGLRKGMATSYDCWIFLRQCSVSRWSTYVPCLWPTAPSVGN